uniref:Uncharacterized protein n=1 Tax=Cucumis melo TaxID=3656 RepID=A0A9I9EG83_CUCME
MSSTTNSDIDTFTLESFGRFAFANIKTPPGQIHTYWRVTEHEVIPVPDGRRVSLAYDEEVRTATELTKETVKAEVLDTTSTKTWKLSSPI